jgi:hypothetical protein
MYEIPSSEQLKEFLKSHELTGSAAARLVGVDQRTVRKWTASDEAANKRAIPWSAWTLLRLYTAEISVDQYRLEVFVNSAIMNADTQRFALNTLTEMMPNSRNPERVGEVMSILQHLREEYIRQTTGISGD